MIGDYDLCLTKIFLLFITLHFILGTCLYLTFVIELCITY